MSKPKYAAYKAADPYFNLVRRALGDLVDGEHFFDIVTDDTILQCTLKSIAADVQDSATQSQSEAAGERHTNTHQPCFMVWEIAVVSIMV
jgi:hypothetical protein